MRYTPVRRRVRPPLPIELTPLPGGGLEIDFGPVMHELNLAELFEDLAIRFRAITKKP